LSETTEQTFEQLYLQALALYAAGARDRASIGLRHATILAPDRVEPLVALSALSNADKSSRRALVLTARALAVHPLSVEALHNRALAFETAGLRREAASWSHRTLASGPSLAVAHDRLGSLFRDAGDASAAVIAHRRASICSPSDFIIRTNLAHALRASGDKSASLAAYRSAVDLDPLNPASLINLGGSLAACRRPAEAASTYRRALALDPQAAEGHSGLAVGQTATRSTGLRRALALDPLLATAHVDLGACLQAASRLDEALAHYRAAAALDPALAAAPHNVAAALLQQGSVDLAEPLFRRAALLADSAPFLSDLLFCLCFKETPELSAVFRDHVRFDRRYAEPIGRSSGRHSNDRLPDRRLRLGYVSANLHRHPVGQALLGLFMHHDRKRFHVHAYAGNQVTDDMTESLLRHADGWTTITEQSDAELAEQVRRDQIDILVDCIGHLPQGRLSTFARRPAPIQVGFPVYPNTSGIRAIDYRIGDVHVSPPAQDRFYTERLLRLPEVYAIHSPADDPDEPVIRSAGPGEPFTFASFNNPAKLGPRTLAAWADILRQAPNARISLKWKGLTYRSPPIRALMDLGVPVVRIDVRDWSPNAYAPYQSVDCCLDPIVNGGNTTYDALWMGVPVVTLRGTHLFARVGTSLLSQVGLQELIAETMDDYIAIAVRLTRNPSHLSSIRAGLRQRLVASPAMNAGRYTRHLEKAYRSIWRRWCAGLPPVSIDVKAEPPSR